MMGRTLSFPTAALASVSLAGLLAGQVSAALITVASEDFEDGSSDITSFNAVDASTAPSGGNGSFVGEATDSNIRYDSSFSQLTTPGQSYDFEMIGAIDPADGQAPEDYTITGVPAFLDAEGNRIKAEKQNLNFNENADTQFQSHSGSFTAPECRRDRAGSFQYQRGQS